MHTSIAQAHLGVLLCLYDNVDKDDTKDILPVEYTA